MLRRIRVPTGHPSRNTTTRASVQCWNIMHWGWSHADKCATYHPIICSTHYRPGSCHFCNLSATVANWISFQDRVRTKLLLLTYVFKKSSTIDSKGQILSATRGAPSCFIRWAYPCYGPSRHLFMSLHTFPRNNKRVYGPIWKLSKFILYSASKHPRYSCTKALQA